MRCFFSKLFTKDKDEFSVGASFLASNKFNWQDFHLRLLTLFSRLAEFVPVDDGGLFKK